MRLAAGDAAHGPAGGLLVRAPAASGARPAGAASRGRPLGRGGCPRAAADIEVSENIEKRDMDGSSLMRIRLHVKADRDETDVALTSQELFAVWKRYEIEYTGGWRQDLTLKVTRLP
jgi:hypothetical protein